MSIKKTLVLVGTLVALAVLLAACAQATPTEAPETPAPVEPTPIPPTPTVDPAEEIKPIFAESGHADGAGEAFVHWDGEAEVPASCAKCHSDAGFQDFLADGKVDAGVKTPNTPFTCEQCHSDAAKAQAEVTFPSGAVVGAEKAGPSLVCLNCHQGRQSKVNVDATLSEFGEDLDPDVVPAPYKDDQGNDVKLGFLNIHYFAAAATLYGAEVQGGYQYDGKSYDAKSAHVDLANSCIGCHDQHSLELRLDTCATCHGEDASDVESLKNIREPSSAMDYDGDGDKEEGVYYEIVGLQETLYASIQVYAEEVVGVGVVYDPAAFPYWFADADGDGAIDQVDGKNVGFSQWTPRLLKAAYNYQTSTKDPGAFAHGGKYIIELLYDSIEDVNASSKLATVFDVAALTRNDAGHFDGSAEAWRHWDAEEEAPFVVPAACAKCHSANGLPLLIAGEEIPAEGLPAGNGLMCVTCHDEANWPALYALNEVTMPSGKAVTFGEGDSSNLCLNCHQGRESKASVDKAIADFGATDVDAVVAPIEKDGKKLNFGFKNIHYFVAGVTIFGSEAQGAYEYDGQTYAGMTTHPVSKCADCHDVHALEIDVVAKCATCHQDATDLESVRMGSPDYDGDAATEGVAGEIETLRDALYAELMKYAKANSDPLVYNGAAYPYFFVDKDGNGKADTGDDGRSISYTNWTPRLLKAAFNYQYALKDPGGFVHNSKYVVQILIDSIADLGGDVSKYTRPE
ncbi:MAG: hypothetical protein ACOYYJ_21700 [Chloroflexota bacterium]